MISMIWNCHGAGGRNFASLIKDYMRIFQLDFIAILEPRISGHLADRVIQKTGLIEGARVDASGFSGGIWCLWKSNFIPVNIVSTSQFCIHLKMNPNTPTFWYFSVVYASPNVGLREQVWRELRDFSSSHHGPWCLAGDFNSTLSAQEREGGAEINYEACNAFRECLEDCGLIDMGYAGSPFTWSWGQLKQRLDRVLCNSAWNYSFPSSSVTHVPLASSDHCGLWFKVENGNPRQNRNYFKFFGAWLDHCDFKNQVKYSWCQANSWEENINRLTSNLKHWNKAVFRHIFKRKHLILKRLEGINKVLLNWPE